MKNWPTSKYREKVLLIVGLAVFLSFLVWSCDLLGSGSSSTAQAGQIVWYNPDGENRVISQGTAPDPFFDYRSATIELDGVTIAIVAAVTLEDDAFFFITVFADTSDLIALELVYHAEGTEHQFTVDLEPAIGMAFESGTLGHGVDFFDENGNGVYDYDVDDIDRYNDYPLFAIGSVTHRGETWTNPHR